METDAETGIRDAERAEGFSSQLNLRRWTGTVSALTVLAYIETVRFGFVHDDRGQIVGNPAVHSWHAIPGYFSSHVWASVAPTFPGNDYRPLFLLWLRINDALFGSHAGGWHFTTVVVHVLATYCVMHLANKISRSWELAAMTGILFGLHPVHIEVVAWVSGVPESLLACLLIPAYLCWTRSRESTARSRQWLCASLALYALALLTKETAVALLPILVGSLWLDFPRSWGLPARTGPQKLLQSGRMLLPFILLTMVYLAVRTVALNGFSHPAEPTGWLTMAFTWPSLLVFYARLFLWPVGLRPFYGLHYIRHPNFLNAILPAVILLVATTGFYKWSSRSRRLGLALLWLVCPLLPVLDVQVFGDGNFAHNRYLYLPSIGFSMLAAMALGKLKPSRYRHEATRRPALWVCAALGLFMGVAIQFEDRYYASDLQFYSFAFTRSDNPDPVIGMDYANALAEQGDFGRARTIFRKVIQTHPTMWSAYVNLGYMYYQAGEFNSALECLTQVAVREPTNAQALFYRALTNLKLNRMAEAEEDLRRAIAIAPAGPNYHFALGIVLKVEGDRQGALAQFSKELQLNPEHHAAAQQAAEVQSLLAGK